jgi:hypothetical protein
MKTTRKQNLEIQIESGSFGGKLFESLGTEMKKIGRTFGSTHLYHFNQLTRSYDNQTDQVPLNVPCFSILVYLLMDVLHVSNLFE